MIFQCIVKNQSSSRKKAMLLQGEENCGSWCYTAVQLFSRAELQNVRAAVHFNLLCLNLKNKIGVVSSSQSNQIWLLQVKSRLQSWSCFYFATDVYWSTEQDDMVAWGQSCSSSYCQGNMGYPSKGKLTCTLSWASPTLHEKASPLKFLQCFHGGWVADHDFLGSCGSRYPPHWNRPQTPGPQFYNRS